MPSLAGKAAIVTGGAKGIGRHYSQALAAEGARVMIADIAHGSELAEEIAARHGANSVASVKFDVSDEKQVQRLVSQTIDRFGQIDILSTMPRFTQRSSRAISSSGTMRPGIGSWRSTCAERLDHMYGFHTRLSIKDQSGPGRREEQGRDIICWRFSDAGS